MPGRVDRSRLRVLLLVIGALAVGAVLGAAREGSAAQQVKPSNTAPPTVSGTTQVGSTLTTSDGSWDGTTPLTFSYEWRRCDMSGGSCSGISGATTHTYDLKQVDAQNTLRVVVTAKNADGSASSTSVPTAVVTAPSIPAPTGCPTGTGVIAISDLAPPARLLIDGQAISPSVVGRSSRQLTMRFHVSACSGRAVQGALLYTTAVPFDQFSIPAETPTGADGWASLTLTQQAGFPASRRQQLLAVFARARKPGESLLGGVSTRRLVSFPVNLNG